MALTVFILLHKTTGTPASEAYFVTELDAKKYMYVHGLQNQVVIKQTPLVFHKQPRKRA